VVVERRCSRLFFDDTIVDRFRASEIEVLLAFAARLTESPLERETELRLQVGCLRHARASDARESVVRLGRRLVALLWSRVLRVARRSPVACVYFYGARATTAVCARALGCVASPRAAARPPAAASPRFSQVRDAPGVTDDGVAALVDAFAGAPPRRAPSRLPRRRGVVAEREGRGSLLRLRGWTILSLSSRRPLARRP